MTHFIHRLLDAMFGPLVPAEHPWALSHLDRMDGAR